MWLERRETQETEVKEVRRVFFWFSLAVPIVHPGSPSGSYDSVFSHICYQIYQKWFAMKHFYSDVDFSSAWSDRKCFSWLPVPVEEGSYLYLNYQHCQRFCIIFASSVLP